MARVDGRIALIYERRDGASMMEHLHASPWRAGRLARTLGSLHTGMHETSAESLPRVRDAVIAAIQGAESIAGAAAHHAALSRAQTLPDGTALCHGDLHPGNVLLGSAGPSIIDWLTAGAGPPAADVARTLLLLRDGALPHEMPRSQRLRIGLLRRWFVRGYLGGYRRIRQLDMAEVAAWRLPLLVARLDEGIEAERAHLLRRIGQEIRGSAG
jgi:aminoglycoside phosphotransferase (APT) family kinase protein